MITVQDSQQCRHIGRRLLIDGQNDVPRNEVAVRCDSHRFQPCGLRAGAGLDTQHRDTLARGVVGARPHLEQDQGLLALAQVGAGRLAGLLRVAEQPEQVTAEDILTRERRALDRLDEIRGNR